MKYTYVLLLGILLIAGCAAELTDEDYEKQLVEKMDTYEKAKSTELQTFSELIKDVKAKMKLDGYKSELKPEGLTLNFEENSNVFQSHFNYWADTSRLGVQNKFYWDEVNLRHLSDALEMPVDSFKPAFNGKGRCTACY